MDIEGNPLVKGKQYIIKIKGNLEQYLGEYNTTKTNLNGKEVFVFKMVYKILLNGSLQIYSRELTFTTDSVRLETLEYYKKQRQSVLGKNKRQYEQEEEVKRLKEDNKQYTEEEIEEDKKFWESVDGGSRRKSKKRKSKRRNIKSKRKTKSKRRKSNK